MDVRTEAERLRRRVEDLLARAGVLGLEAAHRSFRDQAALLELDALAAKLRLLEESGATRAATFFVLDRVLTRLERRCASLAAWLAANGLDAEFTDADEADAPHWPPARM